MSKENKDMKFYGEFLQAGGRDGFLKEVAKAKSRIEKVSQIPGTIKMPVYYYEDESGRAVTEKDGTPVYDFEEMANELENRICDKLGRNVLITLSELDGE